MTTEEILFDKDQLAEWLKEKKPVTILDIRPLKEREEWAIPGSIHVNVYDKLKAGDPNAFDSISLSNSNPIVTVCGSGKISITAAQQLIEKGFHALSLQGGMKAWNFAFNTAEMVIGDVKIIQVRRSAKGCLSYIVGSNNEAVVIDAALDPQVYLDLAKQHGWTIKYVTDTHIHADYVSRSRELAQASSAQHVLIDVADVEYSFHPVKNFEEINFGNASLVVLHTPGHTLESTTFKLGDKAIFSGDTLFVDSIGRPDLKADQDESIEKAKLLYNSLHQLLWLHPETEVLPSHTSKAIPFDNKIVSEKIKNLKYNLKVLNTSKTEFVDYVLSHIPPTPPNYITIASINKTGSHEGHTLANLEAGANRCAIA